MSRERIEQVRRSEFELSYTTSDDGIWIYHHQCHWEKNLGFYATAQDVLDAVRDHNVCRRTNK